MFSFYSQLLKSPSLFFFLFIYSVSLEASQTYILSYQAKIKNSVVISESFHISKSMQEVYAIPAQSLTIHSNKETNIKKIIQKNQAQVLEFLMKFGTHTRSHEKVINNISNSLISITLPPTYITVDFKKDYAIITRLIPNK